MTETSYKMKMDPIKMQCKEEKDRTEVTRAMLICIEKIRSGANSMLPSRKKSGLLKECIKAENWLNRVPRQPILRIKEVIEIPERHCKEMIGKPMHPDQRGRPIVSDQREHPVGRNQKDRLVDRNQRDQPKKSDQGEQPVKFCQNNQPVDSSKSDYIYGREKGVSKKSSLQKSKSSPDFSLPVHKGHYLLSQDEEDQQENETMESFSPRLTRNKLQTDSGVRNWNQYEEDNFQGEHELEGDSLQTEIDVTNPQQHENNSSTSHGSKKRKESRSVTGTKKRRLNKEKLVFEVNECSIIVGPDSQLFITKGGCIMREHAKFDGTTWKRQENSLKEDIIAKCTENSTFDPNCHTMADAMDSQLACQHRNKQHRLHKYYKTFTTKEEATTHPPNGIKVSDWVLLCERFASHEFQKMSLRNIKNRLFNEVPPAVGTVSIARKVDMKRRQGEEVSEIDNYKIAHFSKRKNKMVNEKADEILNDLRTEEAMSSCTPAEICIKKLHHIPGHRKGGSISTKENLVTSNLRVALELEKAKA